MFDKKKYRENFDLKKGDVIICRTNGTLAYVGKPILIDQDYPDIIFPDKLMRLRCKNNILPEYLEYILNTTIARPQIEAMARTAVGNFAIGNDDIFNLKLPLPTIFEQKILVKKIREIRLEISKLKKEAINTISKAEIIMEKLILGNLSLEDL
jgi:type I restriction enzyme S subunit